MTQFLSYIAFFYLFITSVSWKQWKFDNTLQLFTVFFLFEGYLWSAVTSEIWKWLMYISSVLKTVETQLTLIQVHKIDVREECNIYFANKLIY